MKYLFEMVKKQLKNTKTDSDFLSLCLCILYLGGDSLFF